MKTKHPLLIVLALVGLSVGAFGDTIAELWAKVLIGDIQAQYDFGFRLAIGDGVQKNDKEAVKWWRKAAEQGHIDAQYSLGVMYEKGRGVPQDDKEAVKWYTRAAEQGHLGAQTSLSRMSGRGDDFQQDFKGDAKLLPKVVKQGDGIPAGHSAKRWQKAAEQEAGKRFPKVVKQGDGIPAGHSAKSLRKAAEQGDADAQVALAIAYAKGEGVPQDDKESVKWWRKAAEQGNVDAQTLLGMVYDKGEAMPQDYKEAVKWYRMAAEQGDVDAQINLGMKYYKGEGVWKKEKEAVKWWRKAAEQGDANAQTLLAISYVKGEGVRKNVKEAIKWFRKAAEQGYPPAQNFLGMIYGNGEDIPQDDKEAVKWYREAAAQGHASAQCNLGLQYATGAGVPQDYITAYLWWNLAASNGHDKAREYRDKLATMLTPEQIAKAQELSKKIAGAIASSKTARPKGNSNTPKGNGTGFFITNDGYILTNDHVVEDAQRVEVLVGSGKRLKARIVKRDPSNDLAVLKVDGQFSSLPVVSSRGVGLGADVFTVGFPQVLLQGFSQKLTKGSISGLSGIQDDPRNFQISVPIQTGNSGGPLVNEVTGNVVGVVVASLKAQSQNVNYAVKGTYATALLESLPSIVTHLKEPHPKSRKRDFATIAKEVQNATVMVLVY